MKYEERETEVDYPFTETEKVRLVIGISFFVMIFISLIIACFFSSCTLSFQNISTHGVATDLVDENQTASPTTDAALSIPKL